MTSLNIWFPICLASNSCDVLSLSSVKDWILDIWTPNSRWLPEHSMHTMTPKFVDSQVGSTNNNVYVTIVIFHTSNTRSYRGAEAHTHHLKRDRLWTRFPFEEINYLIIWFLRYGVEVFCAFRHSTRKCNVPKIDGKWGVECVNTRLPLPALLHAEYWWKIIKYLMCKNLWL